MPLLLLLIGCPPGTDSVPAGEDSTTPTLLDPATVPLTGACEAAIDFGGFAITADDDETEVSGAVADGVVPYTVLELLMAEGDCAVLRRNNPFCDPTCSPGETCDFDGTCVPYPTNQDLGTVTIAGMFTAVEMAPVFPGNTYYDTSLPNPGYAPGALLTLSMPGGAYGPVELHGVGVEALDVAGTSWVLEGGTDLPITWPPPTGPVVRSEIGVQIAIDQHGVSPSTLQCVFADDGEGTVPGAVLQALEDVGVTGFPNGSLERRTVDHVPVGAGCMDLRVSAPRTVAVDVVGHTPCVGDADCPKGQDCNEALQRCE